MIANCCMFFRKQERSTSVRTEPDWTPVRIAFSDAVEKAPHIPAGHTGSESPLCKSNYHYYKAKREALIGRKDTPARCVVERVWVVPETNVKRRSDEHGRYRSCRRSRRGPKAHIGRRFLRESVREGRVGRTAGSLREPDVRVWRRGPRPARTNVVALSRTGSARKVAGGGFRGKNCSKKIFSVHNEWFWNSTRAIKPIAQAACAIAMELCVKEWTEFSGRFNIYKKKRRKCFCLYY